MNSISNSDMLGSSNSRRNFGAVYLLIAAFDSNVDHWQDDTGLLMLQYHRKTRRSPCFVLVFFFFVEWATENHWEFHSAGRSYIGCWRGIIINDLTQLWVLHAIISISWARCNHRCNEGIAIMRVTNWFLTVFETHSTGRKLCLCL